MILCISSSEVLGCMCLLLQVDSTLCPRIRSEWTEEHSNEIISLKENLTKAPALKQPDYTLPIILTVDSSPIGIGWVISQQDKEGERHLIRFGVKVLSGRQRKYAQVKRELWGIIIAIKMDRDYVIGAEVIVETDCLPVLRIIINCNIPNQAMLRWCVSTSKPSTQKFDIYLVRRTQ